MDQGTLTRREVIRGSLGASALAGLASLTAACGGTTARAASSTGAKVADSSLVSSQVVSQLRTLLDIPAGKSAGQGMSLTMGASMDFSGEGAIYGTYDFNGLKLAVQHIKALGPTINLNAIDSGFVDAADGVSMMRQFGESGYPLVFTSLGADGGAELPYFKDYNLFGLEAGGATAAFESIPFYYQTRALYPQGVLPPLVRYMQLKYPSLKRWAVLCNESVPTLVNEELAFVQNVITAAGFEDVGSSLPSVIQTDFSTNIAQLQALKPDVVLSLLGGAQAGQFLKQYAVGGGQAKVVGIEYLPVVQQIAGNAAKGYIFCFDYFDPQNPPDNQWARLFLSEYRRMFGSDPTYYSANYYETAFLAYALILRIIASGGDPTTPGDAYVNAFNQNPTFPSVYGGDGGATGQLVFDRTTHILVKRAVAVAEATGASGSPIVLATGDIDDPAALTFV
jgi:branched-chain amino acid transport system substrate-binding protein